MYLLFLVALLAEVLPPSCHLSTAHGTLFSRQMLLYLGLYSLLAGKTYKEVSVVLTHWQLQKVVAQ